MKNGNKYLPTPSGLLVPNHTKYDLEIRIKFNTKNGDTELQLHSATLKEFNTLQILGVMSEHQTALLRGMMSGTIKSVPVTEGGNSGDESKA